VERLSLDLCDHRPTGRDHALLVFERGERVRPAEDVEVRLADHLLERSPLRQGRKKARAHE
jgi:hypothetical protein